MLQGRPESVTRPRQGAVIVALAEAEAASCAMNYWEKASLFFVFAAAVFRLPFHVPVPVDTCGVERP